MATPHAEPADRGEERETVIDIAAAESGRDRTAAALDRLVRAGAEAQAELALLRAQQHEPRASRPAADAPLSSAPSPTAPSARPPSPVAPPPPSPVAPLPPSAVAPLPPSPDPSSLRAHPAGSGGVGPSAAAPSSSVAPSVPGVSRPPSEGGTTGGRHAPADGDPQDALRQVRTPRARQDAAHLRSVTSVLHQEHDATRALTEAVRTELSVLFQAKGVAEAERDAAIAQVDSLRAEAASERARVRAEYERVITQLSAYEARVREELAVLEGQVTAQQDQLSNAEAALATVLEQRQAASAPKELPGGGGGRHMRALGRASGPPALDTGGPDDAARPAAEPEDRDDRTDRSIADHLESLRLAATTAEAERALAGAEASAGVLRAQAERIRTDAADDAARVRAAASAAVDQLRDAAWEEAERLRDAGSEEAERLREVAHEEARRVIATAESDATDARRRATSAAADI